MDKELLYEKIERYLAGNLEGDELKTFETKLKNNAELEAEVALHKEVQIALTDNRTIDFENKMIAAFKEAKQEINPSTVSKQKSTKSTSLPKYLAAAASILLLIVAGFLIYQNRDIPKPNLTALITASADYPASISGDIYNKKQIRDNRTEEQTKALQAKIDIKWTAFVRHYENKAFKQGKAVLEELRPYQKQLDQTYFFYVQGITQLQLGEAKEAYAALSKSKASSGELKNSIQWYRALAALMLNSKREQEIGEELLETLANGNSTYQQPARQLLQKIQ